MSERLDPRDRAGWKPAEPTGSVERAGPAGPFELDELDVPVRRTSSPNRSRWMRWTSCSNSSSGPVPSSRAGPPRPGATTRIRVTELTRGAVRERRDDLATEEPLEIRVPAGGTRQDRRDHHADPRPRLRAGAGFLYGEGMVEARRHRGIGYCTDEDLAPEARYNIVTVGCTARARPAHARPALFTSSACGVCGTASLEALHDRCAPLPAARSNSPPRSCTACRTRCGRARGSSARRAACTRPAVPPRRRRSWRSARTWGGTTRWTNWSAGHHSASGCRWASTY